MSIIEGGALVNEVDKCVESNCLPSEIGIKEAKMLPNEIEDILCDLPNMLELITDIENKQNLSLEKNIDKISDMTYDEKVEKQNQEIDDVETGQKDFDRTNTHETGNYGEMKTDQDLRDMGYERVSKDMVTDIDSSGHQGIDGVYFNPNGDPQYLIVDAKYGSAQLNPSTKDGKQMSANWIDKRLDKDVGKEKADEIRLEKLLNPENVETYVAHIDKEGNVSYDKLNDNANVVEKDVKINA